MNPRVSKQLVYIVGTILLLTAIATILLGVFSKGGLAQKIPPEIKTPIATVQHKVIGRSVEGRTIDAYTYGAGSTHLLFVGGMHGGYEWNSVVLAYWFMDYLKVNPTFIPNNLSIAVVPNANPDGVFRVVNKEGRFVIGDVPLSAQTDGTGRFNANNVDLNRNFDCKWKPRGMWKNKVVSAGTSAFSEPESKAIRDFVLEFTPASVVFWHSKANAVYASECKDGILPVTLDIMNAYSRASGYKAVKSFDSYEINGDAEGWLASINIPAITVELQSHENVEWAQNLSGIKALLKYYAK